MTQVTRRNTLNTNQIHLLKIVYKFRFVTSSLIADYKHTDKDSLNKTLQRLVEQKYLIKDYDKSYRIDRKAARYSLAPIGRKLLRDEHGINRKTLHAMYNNKTVKEQFIVGCFTKMQIVINIKQAYPNIFDIYTDIETARDTEFPKPRPNLYLNRIKPQDGINEYFVELHHETPGFLIKKRFKALVQHYDEEGWAEENYPTLLFVLDSSRQEKTFSTFAQEVLESGGIDDLNVRTTTIKAILSQPPLDAIWTDIKDENKLISL